MSGGRLSGWRRGCLLSLAMALIGFAATTGATGTAGATGAVRGQSDSPTASPTGVATPSPVTSTIVVLIDALTPVAPAPGDTVHLAGRMLNNGDVTVADLSLRLRFGPVLSRFDLHRLRLRPETPSGFAGAPQSGPPALGAHATAPFTLDVPVAKLPYLSADGVHALRVEVRGSLGSASDVEVGDGDTFLPVFSTAPLAPTRIAWVVPVVTTPPLASDGALRDNTLTTEISSQGRLSRILAAAAPVPAGASAQGGLRRFPPSTPVTWAVDPMTLQVADLVSKDPYLLHAGTGVVTHPVDPAAARWLTRMRTVVTKDNLLTLPYADVDVVGLAQNDRAAEVVGAFAQGRDTLAAVLGWRGVTTDVWPADGVLSQPAADLLAGNGIASVLLSDAVLPPVANLNITPTAITDLPAGGRTLTAYVADGAISALVAAGPAAAPTPRMAEQLFLAETAMITSQRPSAGQDLVVLPPRAWDPGTFYGRAVIADSSRVPWLKAVTLGALASDPRDVGARQPLTFPPLVNTDTGGAAPAVPLPDPLPADLIASASGTRASLRDLATVFSVPATPAGTKATSALTSALEAALYGAESAAWRGDPTGGYALAQSADAATARLRSRVRAVAARVLTLTSASSPIPVTVVNDLPVDVKVTLYIEADNRAKLASTYRQPVTLPAGAKLRINVPVRVESAGTFTVLVSVRTPSGQPLGVPEQFVIRSAAYGRVALVLTLGALGLLVVAILLRAVRRWRARGVSRDPQPADGT